MQNWDAMQPAANYDQHNTWYNSMFAANIKQEPGTSGNHSPLQSPIPGQSQGSATTQLEQYLKQQQQQAQQQQQQHQAMDTMSLAMTPSPSNNDSSMQHFFDTNIQQQFMQQQQYQQHFQQAQQAAAQNHQLTSTHLTLGFNPLTPPGLPNAVLPPPPPHNSMSHFYASMRPGQQQTPSPQPPTPTLAEHVEKLQAALTPRNTPPMDVTPPKSPKSQSGSALAASDAVSERAEKEHDLISNSSEDMKYIVDSEDDESIRMPIYNSHGKMKNYKCKTCGVVAITKVAFWDHARTHMKPDKILQCPKCPFVTEFKHHLEYHIRKHKNQKPFQCDKCTYTCVNKSMLNSHRKSHSSVYQYRCADCDYATKYCHSFKLHLRKYDHKPGMVLDEEGNPNPSLVIDVYGTRRGPKNKSGSGSGSSKRSSNAAANELKPSNSQLSAALQGFSMPAQAQLQQLQQQQAQPMPVSPAKSSASSTATELPSLKLNMSLQQPQLQQQQQQQQQLPQVPANAAANLLPPLASILQQNRNMAFFPYWNLNLQMLAAQQQAAVLAQLSPRMRESTLQQLQQQQHQQLQQEKEHAESMHDADADEEDEDDDDFERKSVDSAMDLSQGTPTKEEQQQTPAAAVAINLKLQDDDTPLNSTTSTSRRKGRVLKLDTLLQLKSASQSPEQLKTTLEPMPTASSPIAQPPSKLTDDGSSCSADESMETGPVLPNTANTSASSTASSSGNSSNSSTSSNASSSLVASSASASVATVSANGSGSSPPAAIAPGGAIYECKYCDIYFKDAVLYTIHMGYHSCDDVFKCNMCGEKCDGPVGLFVHMARNAHS